MAAKDHKKYNKIRQRFTIQSGRPQTRFDPRVPHSPFNYHCHHPTPVKWRRQLFTARGGTRPKTFVYSNFLLLKFVAAKVFRGESECRLTFWPDTCARTFSSRTHRDKEDAMFYHSLVYFFPSLVFFFSHRSRPPPVPLPSSPDFVFTAFTIYMVRKKKKNEKRVRTQRSNGTNAFGTHLPFFKDGHHWRQNSFIGILKTTIFTNQKKLTKDVFFSLILLKTSSLGRWGKRKQKRVKMISTPIYSFLNFGLAYRFGRIKKRVYI